MSRMPKRFFLLVGVAVFAVVVVACGGGSQKTNGGGTTVSVELKEFSIAPDVSSTQAGKVTFTVKNAGATEHEFVLLKTDLAPGSIPVVGLKADEGAAGVTNVGEIGEFGAGKTVSKAFDLTAGKYVFICNI